MTFSLMCLFLSVSSYCCCKNCIDIPDSIAMEEKLPLPLTLQFLGPLWPCQFLLGFYTKMPIQTE